MRNATGLLGAIVGSLVLMGAGHIFGQDWPQWRGPRRDGKVSGFDAPQVWPKELVQKWKTTVGLGDATPALVGDKLYLFTRQGDEEAILCLNAADAKPVWQNKYRAAPVTGPAARQHAGPRSTPTVLEGKVVTLGASGVVSCVDAASGTTVWRNEKYPGVPRFFTSMSPLVAEGVAIVHLGGPEEGTMVAFELASGNAKWKRAGDPPSYASPVLMAAGGSKQIVALTEKNLMGVDLADGKILWKIPFEAKGRSYNAATPIVNGQTVIYTGQGRGTKAVKIDKQGDGFVTKELWSNEQIAPQFASPVLVGHFLFGATDKGNFYCLDVQTGKTAWTDDTSHGRGFCAMLEAAPVILALPPTSELIAFKADGNKYAELAKFKVADTPTYAQPVVAGKRIFIKDQDSLTLWSLE